MNNVCRDLYTTSRLDVNVPVKQEVIESDAEATTAQFKFDNFEEISVKVEIETAEITTKEENVQETGEFELVIS